MPALYGDEKAKEEFKTLEAFVRNFFKEYESTNSSARNNYEGSGSGSSSVSSGLPINGGFQKFWSDITSIDSDDDEPGDMAELDHYLKEKTLPKDVDLDLLLWWKANGGKYPTLQRMAKDILAIPVSTVASESAFSTSGRLISPHRSRLHPKTLEALMCAQSWLLNEIRATCSEETEAYCRSIEYDYDVEEVACALLMFGENLDDHVQVKDVLVEMGTYFQVQDDYLDCFGSPEVIGKIGTDIEDFKCSWLVVKALELANEEQKKLLNENYGRKDPGSVAKVKELYNTLNLQGVFEDYEKTSHEKLIKSIEAHPSKAVQAVLKSFLGKIYKRQK